MSNSTAAKTAPTGLVGRYFHAIDQEGGTRQFHGKVIAQLDPFHYLLDCYHGQEIFSIDQMTDGAERVFTFFESPEDRIAFEEACYPNPDRRAA